MALAPSAAIKVCEDALKRKLWVLGIDGGYWMSPGFRPDMNTTWSYNPPEEY
ncbi:hypothetical protein VSX61_20980 [Brenneria populi subsp. brevivirga]|uniref:hypothetical protein n=1 Tax=Brenneria populi TaxID=1505588 RepID=UPI002E18F032|nr:hypothetical protein [Brenneria populi subsp. brevivirga]